MSLKENLLKKIRIESLTDSVLKSMGPPDSGKKIDVHAVRGLLEISPYEKIKTRDLELYIQKADHGNIVRSFYNIDIGYCDIGYPAPKQSFNSHGAGNGIRVGIDGNQHIILA